MKAISMFRIRLRARRAAASLMMDCRGIAATEFAIIVPVMLVMFFGVIEISSGVAVDRKVTFVARTLTDLTSSVPPLSAPSNQNIGTIVDQDLLNAFNASAAIMQPYLATPETARLSEIYIDSTMTKATVTWSKAATFSSSGAATLTTSSRAPGDIVTPIVPASFLKAASTYLILSEVSYVYTPTVGYVMKSSVTLTDVAYSRPRSVQCVVYNNLPIVAIATQTPCPTP